MNTNRLFNPSTFNSLAMSQPGSTLRSSPGKAGGQKPTLRDKSRSAEKRIHTIVVPLDGSPFAEHAIPMALAIAEQCDAILHLVHVVVAVNDIEPFAALYDADAALRSLKRRRRKYLNEIAREISSSSPVSVSQTVIEGHAVPKTLDDMQDIDADLVVMATHGRGAARRLWWGSVAHSLLQRASVPVILVRGSNDPAEFAPTSVDNLLLPLDGTKETEKTLDPLLDMGLFPSARHTLLRVLGLESQHVVNNYSLETEWVPSRRSWTAAMRYLHPLVRTLRDDSRRVRMRIVNSDEPVGQIIRRCADEVNADLITLAYRRRSPIARFVWPGTTDYLFRTSNVPLMFVPID